MRVGEIIVVQVDAPEVGDERRSLGNEHAVVDAAKKSKSAPRLAQRGSLRTRPQSYPKHRQRTSLLSPNPLTKHEEYLREQQSAST